MDIIESIKKEADKQHISLAEISRKLGMKQPQGLAQMLNSDSIKFSVVQKIAAILNVSIDYLLGEKQASVQHNIHSPNSPQLNGNGNKKVSYNISAETIASNSRNYQEIIKTQQDQMHKMQTQIDNLMEMNRKLTEKLFSM